MREKQTPKRYGYRRPEIKDSNKKYIAGIAIAIIIVMSGFFFRDIKIKNALQDERLLPEELILGIEANGTSKAYVISALPVLLSDSFNGIPIIITKEDGIVRAFESRMNGRVLQFELRDGTLIDSNGRDWNLNGSSRAGNLPRVNSQTVPWYEWLSAHDNTNIYTGK